MQYTATHCNTLQHAESHCNTPQPTATHCNTLQHTATHCNTLQHTATHCNSLPDTATHCSTLQLTATHCNTLQHTAEYSIRISPDIPVQTHSAFLLWQRHWEETYFWGTQAGERGGPRIDPGWWVRWLAGAGLVGVVWVWCVGLWWLWVCCQFPPGSFLSQVTHVKSHILCHTYQVAHMSEASWGIMCDTWYVLICRWGKLRLLHNCPLPTEQVRWSILYTCNADRASRIFAFLQSNFWWSRAKTTYPNWEITLTY